MNKLFKSILIFLTAFIFTFGGANFWQSTQPVGVELPQATAVFETSLQTGISSSATSMTLTANSVRGGGSISGYNCFTVDEGSSNAETICGTVADTAVSSLTRGISQANGTSTVAALQFSHRRGANVKITDFPILQRLRNQNNGEETFANILLYAGINTYTASTSIVDKNYVDNLSNQGAATSSETVAGISTLATQLQMASSTDNGVNDPLVLQAKYATSSPDVRGLYTIISENDGYLNQNWLDLTEAFTWTGLNTFTATTTLATTTINGVTMTPMFGGTGSDGALAITSGTTTIDISSARVLIKNYDSISITGTGGLAFTNPHASGTVVILRSRGDITLTSSATPTIDASGLGADGGASVTTSTGDLPGTIGTDGLGFMYKTNAGAAPADGTTDAIGGAISTSVLFADTLLNTVLAQYPFVWVGAGGSSGSIFDNGTGSSAVSGVGGKGGGALIMESAGAWNFTTTNGISVAGEDGGNGVEGAPALEAGGGGGGGGGLFFASYNTLTANSGTITIAGGIGGTASDTAVAGGGGGASAENAGDDGVAGVGGDGAEGDSTVMENTSLN